MSLREKGISMQMQATEKLKKHEMKAGREAIQGLVIAWVHLSEAVDPNHVLEAKFWNQGRKPYLS